MIKIRKLKFSYGKEPLFLDLDLDLEAGHIYGLLGKNGAGKTTLLKLLGGLRYRQAGDCSVLGYDPQKRLSGLLEELWFVPEEFYVPAFSAAAYERLYAPLYPRFDANLLASYTAELDLDTGKKLTDLSYGQKKKFLLAFGLASGCRLLLLDEPTNGLDIPSKSQFRKLLASSHSDDRIILISTHQVRDMENLIDPIIILDEGRIIFQQTVQRIAETLTLELEQDPPDSKDVIYSDSALGGYAVLRQNTSQLETRIDLETVFNALTTNRDAVNRLFDEIPEAQNPLKTGDDR